LLDERLSGLEYGPPNEGTLEAIHSCAPRLLPRDHAVRRFFKCLRRKSTKARIVSEL
jgi:hypothetical protein